MDCRRLRLEGALKLRYDQSVGRSRALAKDMEATPWWDTRSSDRQLQTGLLQCWRPRDAEVGYGERQGNARMKRSFFTRTDGLWLTANVGSSTDSTHPVEQLPKENLCGIVKGNVDGCTLLPSSPNTRGRAEDLRKGLRRVLMESLRSLPNHITVGPERHVFCCDPFGSSCPERGVEVLVSKCGIVIR